MHVLALIAWRAGDTIAAARHLARALGESFAMGDYSSSAYMLDLAIPILGDGEHWHAVLVVDRALTDGTLPAPAFNNEGIAEATGARGRGRPRRVGRPGDDANRDRDDIMRYAIAELEALAER